MSLSDIRFRGTLKGTVQRTIRNYNDLINKPAINGHTLIGNQSGHALGLANEDDIINVEANPLGSATADLHKILVDDTIYSIPDVVVYGTASGAIASFDDGGDNKPLKSLKVAINPVQDLHGYDSPWVGGAGKNKLNMVDVLPSGSYTGNTFNCLSFSNRPKVTLFSEPTTIIFSFKNATFGGSNGRIEFFNGSTLLSSKTLSGTNQSDTIQNVTAIKFNYSSGGALAVEEPMLRIATETDATFAPYSNICPISGWNEAEIHRADGATPHIIDDTYNITWSEAGEVFGGELDVTSGVIHPYKYYSSYNGETLVGEWLSSMDVYAEGNTPTIGAQVVDYGAYDTDITVECPTITTLLGNNNIWSDTGEIEECVYQRDLNIVINEFDARITALEQALNSSGTRSLSLSNSAVKEEETEEITEEPKEEEQNEDKR